MARTHKVTTRVDISPERCKDYYEHGYCGFGDTCIFIHDRGDYKSGPQLEADWEAARKKREQGEESSDYEIHSDEEN